jgi:hypothetical protein
MLPSSETLSQYTCLIDGLVEAVHIADKSSVTFIAADTCLENRLVSGKNIGSLPESDDRLSLNLFLYYSIQYPCIEQ